MSSAGHYLAKNRPMSPTKIRREWLTGCPPSPRGHGRLTLPLVRDDFFAAPAPARFVIGLFETRTLVAAELVKR